MWSSQPGLFSHLQPLSLFYTQIHTHTRTQYTLSPSLSFSHTHTHTHTLARTRAQARAPDDNLMTRQQHITACHFCIHSITVLLITCKLISRCPQVTSITLTTKSTTLLDFLSIPVTIWRKYGSFFFFFFFFDRKAVPTYVQPLILASYHFLIKHF